MHVQLQMADTHPDLMHQKPQIERAVINAELSARWYAITTEEKRAADRIAFQGFVETYHTALAASGQSAAKARRMMQASNPRIVLRNSVAADAIQAAEEERFEAVQSVLNNLMDPYRVEDDVHAYVRDLADTLRKRDEARSEVMGDGDGEAAASEAVSAAAVEAAGRVEVPDSLHLSLPPPRGGKPLVVTCSS